jgi:hypothetical protein
MRRIERDDMLDAQRARDRRGHVAGAGRETADRQDEPDVSEQDHRDGSRPDAGTLTTPPLEDDPRQAVP